MTDRYLVDLAGTKKNSFKIGAAFAALTTTLLSGTAGEITGGGDLGGNRTFGLANTSVVAGTYGDAATVPELTVDAKGRLTSVVNRSITPAGIGAAALSHTHAWTDIISGKPTTLAGYGITDAVDTTDARLSDDRVPKGNATGDLGGTYPNPIVDKLRTMTIPLVMPGIDAVLQVVSGNGIAPDVLYWKVLDAAYVGADPVGTAATAVTVHEAALDPHPQYLQSGSALAWADVSGTPTTLSGYGITDGVETTDPRLSDARTPTGAAGGHLSGTYPNPSIGTAVIVDAMISGSASIAWSKISKSGATAADIGAAAASHTQAWSTLTATPTTLAGYGITDGASSATTVTGVKSLTGGGDLSTNRTLELVGDLASPGNSQFYGTNGAGAKGWYSLSGATIGLDGLATTGITGTLTLTKTGSTPRTITFPDATGTVLLTNPDFIGFNIAAGAPSYAEGRVYWDTTDHTLALMTEVNGVTLQVGQEMYVRATNKTGGTLTNGTVVYVNGAIGNRPTIAKAANTSALSDKTIGLVTYDILDNGTGYVTSFGLVRDVDTSAWTAGTEVFIHSTAGLLTSTRPVAPAHAVRVGTVLYQHGTQGVIFVDVDRGGALDDLHNVLITAVADKNALRYVAAESRWENTDQAAWLDTAATWTAAQNFNAGTTVIATADINAGAIDGTAIGASSASTGVFTSVRTNPTAAYALLSAITLSVAGTDANIDLTLSPKGTGSVVISKVDINGGAIDGTVIGGASAAAGTFTTIAGTGVTVRAAANQDGVKLAGRAGGSGDYDVTLTPTTLTADQVITLPDLTGTLALMSQVQPLHGVANRGSLTLSYSAVNRQFTITGTATVYVNGVPYSFASPTSTAHTNATGTYYWYVNASGVLTVSNTFWDLDTVAPLAVVYYNATTVAGLAQYELHQAWRDPAFHRWAHLTQGAQVVLSSTSFAITYGTTDSNADKTYSVTGGDIMDEDITRTLTAISDGAYRRMYRLGASGVWTWDTTNASYPFYDDGTDIQYNQFTGATWQLTVLTGTQYVNVWIFGTTSIDTATHLINITGQTVHSSQAAAEAESPSSISWGTMPFLELVPLYRVTYRRSAADANQGKCKIMSVSRLAGGSVFAVSGGTAATTAAAITFVPAGGISATNVQAALEELDTEKIGGTNISFDSSTRTFSIAGASSDPSYPAISLATSRAYTGGASDSYVSGIRLSPAVSGGGFTISRYNYLDLINPSLGGMTIGDACLFRVDNVPGTHKMIDSNTTKSTPGTVNAWVKVNISGTIYYIPAYTSKTS